MARTGKYFITISWLNSLGGWEYWKFQANKTYGYSISDTQTAKRDIFQDWSANFSGTESEHLSIQASETVRVRSQNLTVQQMNAIVQIKFSLKVMDVTDASNKVTVLVDKGSVQYRTDGEKITTLEFDITYPSLQLQSL